MIFESSNALGLGRNFTLNFGTFTAEEHGTLTATDISGFWTNGKTVVFAGILDTSSLSAAWNADGEEEQRDLAIAAAIKQVRQTSY
ncbi:MAG: hypothetical protein EGS36_11355 [Akkermansia muciniphila]|nr:hypothetical protein [Akkermansia muciniphila]